MRRAVQKFDSNHKVIADAFEKMGATTQDIHGSRAGVPDLLVGFRGVNYLVECKRPKTDEDRAGVLSQAQKDWRDAWRGGKPYVVKTVDEVVSLVRLWGHE